MDESLYRQFVELSAAGRKVQARECVRLFSDSFESFEEKQRWTREFLKRGEFGHKIRHEIYSKVIFPVLEHGLHEGNFECMVWLARTSQNLYDDRRLHERIGFLSESMLLRRALATCPQDEELNRLLLRSLLKWLSYCEHEWPLGILYGNNGATLAECEEIALEVSFGRELDSQGEHASFLDEFEIKLEQYQERLKARG